MLLVTLVTEVPDAWQRQAPTQPRFVQVDGLAIRVLTQGLERRQPGASAVVFESGGSAPLETWSPILPAVAEFAPVVAYDRANTAESAWAHRTAVGSHADCAAAASVPATE